MIRRRKRVVEHGSFRLCYPRKTSGIPLDTLRGWHKVGKDERAEKEVLNLPRHV